MICCSHRKRTAVTFAAERSTLSLFPLLPIRKTKKERKVRVDLICITMFQTLHAIYKFAVSTLTNKTTSMRGCTAFPCDHFCRTAGVCKEKYVHIIGNQTESVTELSSTLSASRERKLTGAIRVANAKHQVLFTRNLTACFCSAEICTAFRVLRNTAALLAHTPQNISVATQHWKVTLPSFENGKH